MVAGHTGSPVISKFTGPPSADTDWYTLGSAGASPLVSAVGAEPSPAVIDAPDTDAVSTAAGRTRIVYVTPSSSPPITYDSPISTLRRSVSQPWSPERHCTS